MPLYPLSIALGLPPNLPIGRPLEQPKQKTKPKPANPDKAKP